MNKIIALMLFAAPAFAGPYFRPIDPHHLQYGAGFLISPRTPQKTAGVTDIALITHSSTDGSIIPDAWQGYLPPESWTPLQVGVGGSFTGDALIGLGTSANIAPVVAGVLLHGVDASSNGWAAATKTALLGQSSSSIRLGVALAASVIQGGRFQNAKSSLPGEGFAEIVSNAARLDVGWAWKF